MRDVEVGVPEAAQLGNQSAVNGVSVAFCEFRIDGRDDEQTIKARVGRRQTLGPVVISESPCAAPETLSGVRVIATTSCPPGRCSRSEMTALPR